MLIPHALNGLLLLLPIVIAAQCRLILNRSVGVCIVR